MIDRRFIFILDAAVAKGRAMNFSHNFAFSGALKTLLVIASIPLPLSFIAGCRHKAVLAADQPVAVRLRAPNHLQEPVSVAASGSVEATLTALTAFQVGGRIARVYVEEGQFVNKGQILAELDATDYSNAYESASGQAAAAKAAALQAKNGVRAQELEQARVDFERARDEYQRQKYLYDHQSLPALDFHKYEAEYLASEQRYKKAQEGTRFEEKDASIARQQAAAADFSQARKRLSDCQLRAPITGFIGMKKIDVGDTVAVGN